MTGCTGIVRVFFELYGDHRDLHSFPTRRSSDPDLRFRRVNRTLARLHGLGHREHLGRLPSEIWPPDVATRVESAVRRVLASDQPVFEADQQIATAVVPE